MSWRTHGLNVVLVATYIGMAIAAGYGKPRPLYGTEGEDITLPHKLTGSGVLRRCSSPPECQTYLMVQNGAVLTISAKVSWNNSTGDIAVKNLQKNDSGLLVLEIRSSSPIIYNLTIRMAIAAGYGKPRPLDGTEGEDITLPDKLMGSGVLRRCSSPSECQTYLMVQNGAVVTISAKVSWNNSTGDTAVKNLQKNDSSLLVLEIMGSSPIIYNLTILTPPGNERLRFLPLVPVLILILVFAGLGYGFGPCKKEARCIQADPVVPVPHHL